MVNHWSMLQKICNYSGCSEPWQIAGIVGLAQAPE
jgi:hypothetical protein